MPGTQAPVSSGEQSCLCAVTEPPTPHSFPHRPSPQPLIHLHLGCCSPAGWVVLLGPSLHSPLPESSLNSQHRRRCQKQEPGFSLPCPAAHPSPLDLSLPICTLKSWTFNLARSGWFSAGKSMSLGHAHPLSPASISACSPHNPTGHRGWQISPQSLVGSLGANGATEQSKDSVGTVNRSEQMIPAR